jgi:hypothetical protein
MGSGLSQFPPAQGSLGARLTEGEPCLPFRSSLAYGSLRARLTKGEPCLPFRSSLAYGSLRARLTKGEPCLHYAVITLMVQAEVRPITWAMPALAPSC